MIDEETAGVPGPVRAAQAASDALFEGFTAEAWRVRGIPLRHPPLFYLGHLPAFAWAQVGAGLLGLPPVDPVLDPLFARGIDPDPTRPPDAPLDLPPLAVVRAYRDAVRARLDEVAADVARPDDPLAAVIWDVVIEHEQMHHETLIYLMAQLDPSLLRRLPPGAPGGGPVRTGPDPRAARWLPVRGGPTPLGDARDAGFRWDDESPPTIVEVPTFELQDLPVTVARFAAFVEDGGYARPELWAPEAWAWREAAQVTLPASWRRGASGIEVRSLFAWHPLDEVGGWPVLVSHAEASAYARWAGARLPTEPELVRAASVARDGSILPFPWGDAPVGDRAALGFRTGGLEPVGSRRGGVGPWGHHDLRGGAWWWTDTPFAPLPGFEPWIRTYPGYSADFFDGEHRVVVGASWATADRLARRSFRNWYRWSYRYAFTGVRLAR
jgi:ergothioneine biosynthesis protein EgtB